MISQVYGNSFAAFLLVFQSYDDWYSIQRRRHMNAVQAAVPACLHKLLYSSELEFGVCSRIIAG